MFTVHTIQFHQREKEKHVFVLLLNSHFIKWYHLDLMCGVKQCIVCRYVQAEDNS